MSAGLPCPSGSLASAPSTSALSPMGLLGTVLPLPLFSALRNASEEWACRDHSSVFTLSSESADSPIILEFPSIVNQSMPWLKWGFLVLSPVLYLLIRGVKAMVGSVSVQDPSQVPVAAQTFPFFRRMCALSIAACLLGATLFTRMLQMFELCGAMPAQSSFATTCSMWSSVVEQFPTLWVAGALCVPALVSLCFFLYDLLHGCLLSW